jgi:transposase-like protein
MKAEDFRGLVEQLGDLTEVQRAALLAALAGKGAANEAVALIETRFAAAPACGHCGSESFGTLGQASGLRRYKCRDCHRTFDALTGTPLAQLHRRDAWLGYARALVDRVRLRKAAERGDVCLKTSFLWRHRFLAAARDKRPAAVTGIVAKPAQGQEPARHAAARVHGGEKVVHGSGGVVLPRGAPKGSQWLA